MTEARRLAAIMAVDVVGYSRLMGEDEAGTARRVREHREAARPLVAARDGRIVKTMGDGLLLEFPSVVAAVDCALAIQWLMAERTAAESPQTRIVYRIGVSLGDVLIDGDDILGDGVNIAARLEALCEPGGVLISGAAHEQVRGKLDATFADLGEKSLKNISRPIRTFSWLGARASPPTKAVPAPTPQGPPRLSLVVLPFANMGGGEDHEYFVDGVTESLTTDLSRIRSAFVIGRNTAFTYKAKAVDLRALGRDLNVRYVLEGSVQRGGARMRVNVQLIEAETGAHVWAERFDKPVGDLFDMQDEIIARLAGTLSAQWVEVEARSAGAKPDPNSMDHYFQGQAWYNKGATPENILQAAKHFERALAIDPGNVEALVACARKDIVLGVLSFNGDPHTAFASAERALANALSRVPDHALGQYALALLYCYTRRASLAIGACRRALALDRNLASAHAVTGLAMTLTGRAEETEAHVEMALRLSPYDTLAYSWMGYVANAKCILRNYDEALVWRRRAIEANRSIPFLHFCLAYELVRTGQVQEARAAVQVGRTLEPLFTGAGVRAHWGDWTDEPKFKTHISDLIETLIILGVPA